jgi:hypothetical protein
MATATDPRTLAADIARFEASVGAGEGGLNYEGPILQGVMLLLRAAIDRLDGGLGQCSKTAPPVPLRLIMDGTGLKVACRHQPPHEVQLDPVFREHAESGPG